MTLGAQLKISRQAASSGTTNTPATQPNEPGIITLKDGRKFEVKLMMQLGGADGKKYDVDMSKVSKQYLEELVERSLKGYKAVAPDTGKPLSFTVHFTQYIPNESILSSTIGNIFTRFKDDPATLIELKFKKLEYQTSSGSKEVFDLEKDEFDEAAAKVVNEMVEWATHASKALFANPDSFISKTKKIKPPVQEDPFTKALNDSIDDAGASGNRCASLSVAKIELAKLTPQEIVDKYDLTTPNLIQSINDATDHEAKIKVLSEALIEKAAAIIENPDDSNPFLNKEIQDENKPCLAAVKIALQEVLGHEPTGSAQEIVQQYADRIREDGEQLNLPFFLALEKPFIILHTNDHNQFDIRVLGALCKIPDSIENYNPDEINIFYYSLKEDPQTKQKVGHYQPVTLSQDDQKAAMRVLLRREITGQIEAFIPRLQNNNVTSTTADKELDDLLELFRLYPKAQEEIIERFKREYPARVAALGNLNTSDDFEIASNLRAAIHGGPIVTFPR